MGTRRIDINTAGVDELATLLGVGRARAEAIVEKREVSEDDKIWEGSGTCETA